MAIGAACTGVTAGDLNLAGGAYRARWTVPGAVGAAAVKGRVVTTGPRVCLGLARATLGAWSVGAEPFLTGITEACVAAVVGVFDVTGGTSFAIQVRAVPETIGATEACVAFNLGAFAGFALGGWWVALTGLAAVFVELVSILTEDGATDFGAPDCALELIGVLSPADWSRAVVVVLTAFSCLWVLCEGWSFFAPGLIGTELIGWRA